MNLGIFILFGIGILGGIISALFIRKLRVPQILGYIICGFVIGASCLNIVKPSDIHALEPFNMFALGIIGFLVGGELSFKTFRKYGKQFAAILLGEGLTAFFLVSAATTAILYFVTHSMTISLAAGVIIGAISSATDPATTMSVLWEYRTAGVLTTTLIAIVALDDALAMLLYALATGLSQILTGGEEVHILTELFSVGKELLAALLLGTSGGFLVSFVLHKSKLYDQNIASSIATLLLCVGVGIYFDLDVVLVAMAMGLTIANTVPKRCHELFKYIKELSIPIYVFFFVLIGARIQLNQMPLWLWGIIISYVILRTVGKMTGAYYGAKISKASDNVRKYTGLGLAAQGGVTIGLSIMAGYKLQGIMVADGLSVGNMVIFTIATTTFLIQIVGPSLVKLAVIFAKETHKNVTEQDIIEKYKAGDKIVKDVSVISPETTLKELFNVLSQSKRTFIPLTDKSNKLVGIISLNDLKDVLIDQTTWEWVLAGDLMNLDFETVENNEPLSDVLDKMNQIQAENIAVIDKDGNFVGIIDRKNVINNIRKEMILSKSE